VSAERASLAPVEPPPSSPSRLTSRFSTLDSLYSVAFLGFMSVSGIPAFLEERSVFVRERANGLYGPGAYLLANTVVSIPFLFACTVVYTLIGWTSLTRHLIHTPACW
jgi:hypothetical protein